MTEMEITSYAGGPVQQHPSLAGFTPIARDFSGRQNRRIAEMTRMYRDAIEGRLEPFLFKQALRPTHEVYRQHLSESYPGLFGDPGGRQMGLVALRETMARTDYGALFADSLDRAYYGFFADFPLVVEQLAKVVNLRDFRIVKRYTSEGMVSPMTFGAPEEPPTQSALTGASIEYQPAMGQVSAAIHWSALANDDLGIFQDVARRLALQANRGISRFITGKLVDINGPLASLYNATYKNRITVANGALNNNPVLGQNGLSDAFDLLFSMKDSSGEPIMVSDAPIYLWYGPKNEVTAQNLANMISVYTTNRGGAANSISGLPEQMLNVNPWLINRVRPIMLPHLEVIATNAPGTWGLMVDPNRAARPAIEIGYLNGFRTPQSFLKAGNTLRPGGGVDPMMGDFYTGDQEQKVVSVIGGAQVDGRTTVASSGSGSA